MRTSAPRVHRADYGKARTRCSQCENSAHESRDRSNEKKNEPGFGRETTAERRRDKPRSEAQDGPRQRRLTEKPTRACRIRALGHPPTMSHVHHPM